MHDINGAVLGAVGLVAFALAFEDALRTTTLGYALARGLGAWLATSVALYLVLELTRRRGRAAIEPRPGGVRPSRGSEELPRAHGEWAFGSCADVANQDVTMQLERQAIVVRLRKEGKNEHVQRTLQELPEKIDHEQHTAMLQQTFGSTRESSPRRPSKEKFASRLKDG